MKSTTMNQFRSAGTDKTSRRVNGFTNQTALLLIATCYPLGIAGLASFYTFTSQTGTSWSPPQLASPVSQAQISEQEATSVIEAWWSVRSRVFASPYDVSAASDSVSSGPLWTDLTKPDGPVSWLRNNNQYYTYQSTTIQRVISFDSANPEHPSIVISVSSKDTLNGPSVYKPSSSTSNFRYIFEKEDGKWKIWDYEKV
jgi:hypothetical protein